MKIAKPFEIPDSNGNSYTFHLLHDGEDCKVFDFIIQLQPSDQKQTLKLFGQVQSNGLPHNTEKYKKLAGFSNLHELKADKVRILFCLDGTNIILLLGYMKQTQRAPRSILEKADRISGEWIYEQ